MQKKGLWFLIVIIVLVALSLAVGTPIFKSVPGLKDLYKAPKYGLDVAGGVRFTFKADVEKLAPEEQAKWATEYAPLTLATLGRRAAQGLGVVEGNVYMKGTNRFVVELPGFTNVEEARRIMSRTARLEFYWARNTVSAYQTTKPYTHENDDKRAEGDRDVFRRTGASIDQVIAPGTEEWKRMVEGWKLLVTGDTLQNASVQSVGDGKAHILLQFNPEGTRVMRQWASSDSVLNKKQNLAIILEGRVIQFAYVMDGNIFQDGSSVIQGNFQLQEAQKIVDLLKSGALKTDLIEEDVKTVAPAVGTSALQHILNAGMISFAIIALFVVVYYVFPGFVALLALCCYTLFCYAVFNFLGVTFSLAAIAGFILSIGMAVDANILIFERMKEELRHGRSLLTSIDLGFKRAFPAILDSNVCTIITCVVLSSVGTGPVKGFATTLMAGVLISLFTAVTVTRSLLMLFQGMGFAKKVELYGTGRGWFGERLEAEANDKPLRIMKRMGTYFAISLALIIPGLIFMGMGGLKYNVEFLGGVEAVVELPAGSNLSPRALNDLLEEKGIVGANTKITSGTTAGTSEAFITVPLGTTNPKLGELVDSQKPDDKLKAQEMIAGAVGADTTVVEKTNDEGVVTKSLKSMVGFERASETVRKETWIGAIWGVAISSVLIVVWLSIRFAVGGFGAGLRFGFSAIVALLHDVVVVLGLAAIMGFFKGWEVSQLTITAMLTVIGFSVHDTIVIFDRIRENLRHPLPGENFDNLVDRSITQSFARSINTSATVIVTLAILVGFSATPDLQHFCLAMLVGIISGTYSSIFNASPILALIERRVLAKKGASHTLMQNQKLRAPVEDADGSGPSKSDSDDTPTDPRFGQTKRKNR
ncbi:MAG: protein translocase subunit SecD [Fimbriimonadales bacterium]